MCGFPIIFVLKETSFDALKPKSPCFLLNKNIKSNKNETESKIDNPTHSFIEMKHVLQLVYELRITSKTVMSRSLRKKKVCTFCNVYFVRRNFFIE